MNHRSIRFALAMPVALLALGTAACGSNATSASGSAGAEGTIIVGTLGDSAISLTPATAPAGSVTFEVENGGSHTHEFEVFSTDLAPDALAVSDGVVSDDGLTLIEEVEDIAPGTSAELQVDLDAGSYVIICNLPGHYEDGMHAGFEVA